MAQDPTKEALELAQLVKGVTDAKRKLVDKVGNWPEQTYRRHRLEFDAVFEAIDKLEAFYKVP
jgi:hypothetical protein